MPIDEGTELDGDQIYNQAYGLEDSAQQQQTETPVPPPPREYEFDWKGQKIKADEGNVLKWASQGYDYAQNINQFKSQKDSWEKEKTDWETKITPYREIDDFARKNQDWWNHVSQSYQQRQTNQQQEIPPYLEPVVKDYPLIKNFIQEYQREKEEKRISAEDAQLAEEIKSIQGKYKDLDFSSADASGQSLEARVISHAVANKIPTFRAAFLDYYHDHLESLAEARGKESFVNEQKKKSKAGLLGETSTPTQGLSELGNGRKKSWNEIHQETLRELNLT